MKRAGRLSGAAGVRGGLQCLAVLVCVHACGGRSVGSDSEPSSGGDASGGANGASAGVAVSRGGKGVSGSKAQAGDHATSGGLDVGLAGRANAGASEGGAAGANASDCADCLAEVTGLTSDFGMQWRDSWFLVGCLQSTEYGCDRGLCPGGDPADFEDKGMVTLETFPIGGIPGQRYKVTFTFNAIASAKDYQGGTRDDGDHLVSADGVWDSFYRDGYAVPSSYDVWRLSVFDEQGVQLRHYYMNSFPLGQGFEARRTYPISYTKSVVVVGGGKVTHRIQDSNCRAIDNCAEGTDEVCIGRSLPNEPTVTLPAQYQEPVTHALKPLAELTSYPVEQPWHAQLGHLVITAVEPTEDPVTHDYL